MKENLRIRTIVEKVRTWIEKMGVWVWMAGEGRTRGASFAFRGIPTHSLRLTLPFAFLLLISSCKTTKHHTKTTIDQQHYEVSRVQVDTMYQWGSRILTLDEHFDIEIWLPSDTLKPAKVIKVNHDKVMTDTATTSISHSAALQSTIDSTAYTYTTDRKNVQHNANLFSMREYLFIAAILLLVLLIMVRRNSNISH